MVWTEHRITKKHATMLLRICSIFPCLIALASSFNLDTRIPIVKFGDAKSFFGYSVSQHQIQLQPNNPGSAYDSVILVGAPRANTTQPGTVSPGTVYRCPITTRQRDCTQIDLSYFTKNQPPPRDTDDNTIIQEIADDGWLGVSVRSRGPGGPVAACAHRYRKAQMKGRTVENEMIDAIYGQGMCHVFGQDLTLNRSPLEACAGKRTTGGHLDFGVCQAGVSSEWVAGDDQLLMGAPGALNWRGAIYSIATAEEIGIDTNWYSSEKNEYKEVVTTPSYLYLGMAVTSGYFYGKDQLPVYIAGAPRSNLSGEVFIFRKVKPAPNKERSLEFIEKLAGDQVASQFGYSLTSVDLNGDSLPDLVVGAPFYFQSDGQGGQKGGAVFIYMNSGNGLGLKSVKPKKLSGPVAESMFGMAVANVSDLNLDGFQDLAVGAPYDEGGGSVHIFQGSSSGVKDEPSQIIRARDLPISLSTFGYSLFGGLDLDDNGYPDVLSGAYSSDAAVLLRARPVIKVGTDVKNLPKYVTDPFTAPQYCLDSAGKNLTCFTFRPCFTVSSQSLNSFTGVMHIEYRIEAETFQRGNKAQYSRVKFLAGLQETPNVVKRTVIVTWNNWAREQCERETVLLQEGARDVLNPVWFKLTYTLVQDPPTFPAEGQPVPAVNNYPILDQTNASKIFQVKFYKDCGTNDVCESDLRITGSLNLPKDAKDMYSLVLGENNQIVLNFTLRNENEAAYETFLYIEHPKELEYIGTDRQADSKPYSCVVIKDKDTDLPLHVRCDIGNPFPRLGEVNISMRFNTTNLQPQDRQVSLTLYANTTSNNTQRDPLVITANVVIRADIQIIGTSDPSELFYSGVVTGASAMTREDQIGLTVNHTYQVRNSGPAKLSQSKVTIYWPLEVENRQYPHGKYLLYLLHKPITDGPVECNMDDKYINPANISLLTTATVNAVSAHALRSAKPSGSAVSSSEVLSRTPSPDAPRMRQKREKIVQAEERRVDNKKIKVVRMGCERETAKCIKISCQIRELSKDQPVVIRLRARLWNSTFLEDYRDIDTVEIQSFGVVEVDTGYFVEDPLHNNKWTIQTNAKPDVSVISESSMVAWWIILLAVLGGILLLLLLICILYKCGFFKRKTPEDLSKRQTPSDMHADPYETERMSPQSDK
ncbi:integrin alpha-PS1-like [Paramacrobiotus metropolitanus]|uniref:integrin alpha-PS1-like n=1 Tax=Paramacrobiotus metropolitanus TaxID=2943436 RepID=UPI002445D0F6|nr:integrin alpha-PS1-like [Paramacrobiotus metropolitanus]